MLRTSDDNAGLAVAVASARASVLAVTAVVSIVLIQRPGVLPDPRIPGAYETSRGLLASPPPSTSSGDSRHCLSNHERLSRGGRASAAARGILIQASSPA